MKTLKKLDQAKARETKKHDQDHSNGFKNVWFLSGGQIHKRLNRKKIFEIAGCTFPEDWDSLSIEEKTKE